MSRFHFALGHLDDSDSLQVNLHEHTFALAAHTEDSLREAKNLHPVLSQVAYVRSYRFNKMQVQTGKARLGVYGQVPVLIENLSEYAPGVAFYATANLLNALSLNAVGPAGLPFSWLGQGLIDAEAFSTAFSD